MKALLRKYEEVCENIRQNKDERTVLFADLKGSTIYKILNTPEKAQTKIFRHNETVTQGIKKQGGEVVKYLGDGVMAIFQGKEGEINAIKAAIIIQKEFRNHNKEQKLENLDKIQSKIGINTGEVYIWDYEGQKQPDPQGTAVDIASRICELAKPEQILCSAICKMKCANDTSIKFGKTVCRELKGIPEKVGISEVIWADELMVEETPHISPPNPRIEDFLVKALINEEQENYNTAVNYYTEILKEDNLHFIANIKLASIIRRYSEELKDFQLEDALSYAEKAKESNPKSAQAKLLYSLLLWQIREERKEISKEVIRQLITETKIALDLFKKDLNTHGEIIASNNLAYFYGEIYEEDGKEYLDEAIKLCKIVEQGFSRLKDNYIAFLDTYAYVLMKKGEIENLIEAYDKLKKAEENAHSLPVHYIHLPFIYDHLSELCNIAKNCGISSKLFKR